MLGHVAHALERGADAQGADHDAQVAGDRVLAGQDLDGELVEVDGERVDLVVVGDDRLGQRDVGLVERAGRVLDRDGDEGRRSRRGAPAPLAAPAGIPRACGDRSSRRSGVRGGAARTACRAESPCTSCDCSSVKVNGRCRTPEHLQSTAREPTAVGAAVRGSANRDAWTPAWLVPSALAFGLLVGAGRARRRGRPSARRAGGRAGRARPSPTASTQVLDALESAGVVLDPSNNVLKASPGARRSAWSGTGAPRASRARRTSSTRCGATASRQRGGAHPRAQPRFGEASSHLACVRRRLGTRYVLLLAEDRTESHRLDEVRRDFVANISHELKTPIGAVGLLAEALDAAVGRPGEVRRFAAPPHEGGAIASPASRRRSSSSARLQAADALAAVGARRRRQRGRRRRRPQPGRRRGPRHRAGHGGGKHAPRCSATRPCS